MSQSLNLELNVAHPRAGGVVGDYLSGAAAASAFYARRFDRFEDFQSKVAEVDGRFDRDRRSAAVAALRPAPGRETRLEHFVEQGGYMVTTGQQPGLFGGPLYSIYKGLTAINLAQALEARLQVPVLPVFWVASEDHDWEEANHTYLLGTASDLHRAEVAAPNPDVRPSLHRVPMGEDIADQVSRFIELLPPSDFRDECSTVLLDAYTPGSTLSESFHVVLESLLGPHGLFFVDANDAALKEASRATLAAAIDRGEELEGVLRETGSRLEEAGYPLQVSLMENGIDLFLDGDAGRERLYRDGDGFTTRGSGSRHTHEELHRVLADEPQRLSPNVLLRPVVESRVFPTLAYVGGPGEMAYFAQLGAYFQAHGLDAPIVYPRWSADVVEAKIRKVLGKFDVEIDDLDRPFHEIAGEMARDEVPQDVRAALGKLRGTIGASAGELQKVTAQIDPTLKGSVQHLRSQSMAAIDDLEKKVVQAVKRETDIRLQQLEKAQIHLFPNGKPAERVLNPFYFLARYGTAFVDALHDAFVVNLE